MVCDLSDIFMERTFQHGTFVTDFGLIGFRPVTSFRLWSTDIILSFVEGPLLLKIRFLSVSFSVSVTQSYHLSGGLAYPKVPGIFWKATGQSLPLSCHWPVEFLPGHSWALCRWILLLTFAGVVKSPLFIHSWIWFGIGVFLLLDRLPTKAYEPHLSEATGFQAPVSRSRPFSSPLRQFRHEKARSWTLVVRGCILRFQEGACTRSWEFIPNTTPWHNNLLEPRRWPL